MFDAERFNILRSSAESELLVHCTRLDIDPDRAKRILTLLEREIDWRKLFSLAQRNALIPLLYFQLNKIAPSLVPTDRLKELSDRFQDNSALNTLLTAEMIRLIDLFEQNEIPTIPYKGPAIGAGVYGQLALRQFADLDILVRENDVWKATDLLLDRGYEAHFVIPVKRRLAFIRLSYVRSFNRDNTTVELHWRLAPRFFGAHFDTSKLWERTRKIPLQGSYVRIPFSDDLILMLCIHGAKDCWEKLEWVCGLAEVVRADPELDWDDLLKRAKDAQATGVVSLGLLLAHDLLEAPIPVNIVRKLRLRSREGLTDQIVARFFTDSSTSFSLAQRLRLHLELMDSISEKARYCLRLSLTTTPVDWEMISLPESASFLYYPLRALRLLKKYGRKSTPLTAKDRSIGPV
jgi:Uncharacterised nucleotidyltransferase